MHEEDPALIKECVARTSLILKVDEDYVLKVLEHYYPYIEEYSLSQTRTERVGKSIYSCRCLNYLSGPDTFIFFKPQTGLLSGKRILLLGEHHNNKTLCSAATLKKEGSYQIQKWLVDICDAGRDLSNVCVDVLTESPYKYDYELKDCGKKLLQDYRNPLYAITCELNELKKQGNLPKNMRYHNVDLRRYKDRTFPGTKLHDALMKNSSTNTVITNDKNYNNIKIYYEKNKISIISYLLGLDRSSFARNTYHKILSLLLGLLNEEFDVDESISLEKDYFELIDKELSKMDKSIIPTEQRRREFLYALLDIYSEENMYTVLMVIPMDLYLLTRIFVVFDEDKMYRRCEKSRTMNYSIIYTGAAHTRYYRLFLEKFFGVKADVTVTGKRQCLKLNCFDFFG